MKTIYIILLVILGIFVGFLACYYLNKKKNNPNEQEETKEKEETEKN
jgi:regulatory protein YycI of two-component signal transduction system YycFG